MLHYHQTEKVFLFPVLFPVSFPVSAVVREARDNKASTSMLTAAGAAPVIRHTKTHNS